MRDPKLPASDIPALEYIAPPAGGRLAGLSESQCNELLDYAVATDSFDGLLEGRSLKDLRTMCILLYARFDTIKDELKKPQSSNVQKSNISKCLAILKLLIVLRENAKLDTSFLKGMIMLLESELKQLQNATTKTVSDILKEEAEKIKAASTTQPAPNPNKDTKKLPFGRY